MFFKNLKFFLRSFRKDKTFVAINLFGMSAGILVAMLTGFYAFYQLSYDKFIENHENIYRIEYVIDHQLKNKSHRATCSESLANILKTEVPGIKDILIIHKPILDIQFDCEGKSITLSNSIFTTKKFLDLYDVEFIIGSKESSFNDKTSLLITESFANKYFPQQDPVGKDLKLQHSNLVFLTISGVIKDLPTNSHFQVETIRLESSQWPKQEKIDDYSLRQLISSYKTIFLILDKNASIDNILDYFSIIKDKYMRSYLEKKEMDIELEATKITDIHFKQNLLNDQPVENLNSIYYFLIVALIVIIISIINYINLSLARYTNRNIDIGIRKTIGASKSQIFSQYLSESFLFIIISFIIASIIFLLVLSSFADFIGINLIGARFSYSGTLLLIPAFFLVAFFTGFYPALITARKNPIQILHSRKANQKHIVKRIFIIIQIILSITFFIGTMMIFLQMKYVKDTDKGYNIENVIAYEYYNYGSSMPTCDEICDKLKESAYINDVAVSTNLPGQSIYVNTANFDFQNQRVELETEIFNIDENYLPFMDIGMIYGRNFDENLISDSNKIIVNEAFARYFLTTENVIGARVYLPRINLSEDDLDAEIIGVVRDFHFQSMHNKIGPIVLTNIDFAPNFYHIKYDTQNFKYVTEHSQKVFDDLKFPFAVTQHFPEEELLKKYETEKHLSEMTVWLAVLSILLAVLGVFGLTAFVVRNNMKMLSVRKVFGAEKKDLFRLMFKDYSSVLIISNIVAIPLTWYVCTKWLERFAYRISLPLWLFASGIVMSVLIVFLAVSYHVFKVSKTDPVVYLQDE